METFKTGEFSRLTGVAIKTLQKWDREGKLKSSRTASNRRFYTHDHLAQVTGRKVIDRLTIVYLRVSSNAQKPDLINQRASLEQFCVARGFAVSEWVDEIGGGMNMKRKRFLALVDMVCAGRVERIVVAHKDRLMRFGFDLFAHLCAVNRCEIVVLNSETLSPEREMVEDLMTITHCFSARLNGLRKYKKALSKAVKDDTGA